MIVWYATTTTTDGRIIHYGCDTEKEETNEVISYEEKMDTYTQNVDIEKYY